MRRLAVLMFALAMVTCVTQSEKPPELPPDAVAAGTIMGNASIEGRVMYLGTPPDPGHIDMRSDVACHRKRPDGAHRENLLVNSDGSLRNVFVHVAEGIDKFFAPPETPVRLNQQGCIYEPRVIGMQVGQPLLIVNSDPTLHNVHSVSETNAPFNFGMAVEGQTSTRYFHAEEITVKLKCDVHPWMSAYVGVVSHPYHAVTGERGSFLLEGLAAGEYVVEAWHEDLGVVRQSVVVGEGERATVAFDFPVAE